MQETSQSLCGAALVWIRGRRLLTNYRYLPTGMIGLNSKNLSLPRQKSEADFVLPAVEGEKPTCISFL